ncbi:ATP-grasp domain-containing protein [Butyrivibrio sp. WCD3002]|uniref:ATP-grasp domain-containing protein n=1 Tax=Butyrivibrio sp. WCD3002 TaxID=1280676 RepID=UPI0003FCDFD6|nr:ATP-grasp domain-containing protein [Butyrivibrio sp. WCD3002]
MEKLLFLGDNTHCDKMVLAAKARGIFTILSDNKSVEESKTKLLADEYWDISVLDIDALETKCRECGITGVLCGASEICMGAVRELCKRLSLPFWISDKAWEYTNDKVKFKTACKECGLPVATEYDLTIEFLEDDLNKIEYPVVVKPSDGCSSIGMHICHNENELRQGYEDAYEHSTIKKVVVEKYFTGRETAVFYVFSDGKPYLFRATDTIGIKEDGNPIVFAQEPSNFLDDYESTWKEPMEKLFSFIECKVGCGIVQLISDGKETVVMEMNYRLPGGHNANEHILHKHMIDGALGIKTCNEQEFEPKVNNTICTYALWLKPGKISTIEGAEEVRTKLDIVSFQPFKKVGDEIDAGSGMRRIFSYISFKANKDEFADCVDMINKTLNIYDENGNDMVYKYQYK